MRGEGQTGDLKNRPGATEEPFQPQIFTDEHGSDLSLTSFESPLSPIANVIGNCAEAACDHCRATSAEIATNHKIEQKSNFELGSLEIVE
jgi:hypothetical protein